MNVTWQDIVEALRTEAAEGGRLLGLFDEQQKMLFQRQPETVLELGRAIQRQTEVLNGLRGERQRTVAAFATDQGQPPAATLRSLLGLMPADARPLVEALIGEVNHLIHRLRRSARLNHRLLACMVECHQEVLRRLRPDAFTKTYSPTGRVSVAGLRPMPSIQTAG
jgi:flagellar biosynthesis/type III secretory pathway chaperone